MTSVLKLVPFNLFNWSGLLKTTSSMSSAFLIYTPVASSGITAISAVRSIPTTVLPIKNTPFTNCFLPNSSAEPAKELPWAIICSGIFLICSERQPSKAYDLTSSIFSMSMTKSLS